MRLIFIGLFCLINWKLVGQNGILMSAGARGAAMGNASVTFYDINSAFSNQAGLANLEQWSATATVEQRFLVAELQSAAVAAAVPMASGTFALTLHHFGVEAFQQQKFGLAYARRLMKGLSAGAQITALHTSIPEYGNRTTLSFEIGLLTELLPQLQLGMHLANPVRVELVERENLPTVLRLGLAYLPSERLTCTAEVEKDIDFMARMRFGIEYQLVEQLALRTGITTGPTQLAFGVGYAFRGGLSLDVASVYHQWLGFMPVASVSFQRK